MKTLLTITAIGITALLTAPATHAIDLGGLFGNKTTEQSDTSSAQDTLGNAARSRIDSFAGQGATDTLTGKTNPIIGIVLNQLGIPSQYAPQIQSLYQNFTSDGDVTATEVNNQQGLSKWLGNQPSMDASGLATALTSLFSKAQ